MKYAVVLFALIWLACATESQAEAYPGMLCYDSSGCSRCEVCVKPSPYAASGHCMVIAGCY